MRTALLFAVVLSGCVVAVTDDVPGHLGRMTVVRLSDTCMPMREVGDAGVQFLGRRGDGGLVFTFPAEMQFGPPSDGGSLSGLRREQAPAADGGVMVFGAEEGCRATTSGWVEIDGGLRLTQWWTGIVECPAGPSYLPETSCKSTREVVFEPMSECALRCVRISESTDVTCECGR